MKKKVNGKKEMALLKVNRWKEISMQK